MPVAIKTYKCSSEKEPEDATRSEKFLEEARKPHWRSCVASYFSLHLKKKLWCSSTKRLHTRSTSTFISETLPFGIFSVGYLKCERFVMVSLVIGRLSASVFSIKRSSRLGIICVERFVFALFTFYWLDNTQSCGLSSHLACPRHGY